MNAVDSVVALISPELWPQPLYCLQGSCQGALEFALFPLFCHLPTDHSLWLGPKYTATIESSHVKRKGILRQQIELCVKEKRTELNSVSWLCLVSQARPMSMKGKDLMNCVNQLCPTEIQL